MNNTCITYKELAVALKLSESTVKHNWRYYPHFYITAKSEKSQNLKGVRFILEDVLEFLKENSYSQFNQIKPTINKQCLTMTKEKKNVKSEEKLTYNIFDFNE